MAPKRQRRKEKTPSPQQEPVIEPNEDYPTLFLGMKIKEISFKISKKD